MTDSKLRQLERRFKETGSLDDEVAYFCEIVRTDLSAPAELFNQHCSEYLLPSWEKEYSEGDDRYSQSYARAVGKRKHDFFSDVPGLALSVIQEAYTGEVPGIPDDELVLTALVAHYAKLQCLPMERTAGELAVLHLKGASPHKQFGPVWLLQFNGGNPGVGKPGDLQFATYFPYEFRLKRHNDGRALPLLYTFFSDILDDEGHIMGEKELLQISLEAKND